jgi:hypothetical protein
MPKIGLTKSKLNSLSNLPGSALSIEPLPVLTLHLDTWRFEFRELLSNVVPLDHYCGQIHGAVNVENKTIDENTRNHSN